MFTFVVASLFSGCRRSSEELPVMPPATPPLTREYIGFGVVTISFAHLSTESDPDGVSQGYLRRGTVVRVIERMQVNKGGNPESWVMVESNYTASAGVSRGWLQESSVEIYDSESQANTASKTMNQ